MAERQDGNDLDHDLAALRDLSPAPSEALLARVAAMGLAEMPRAAPSPQPGAGHAPDAGWFATLIGGWRTASGLASAMAVGLAVGLWGSLDLSLPATAETLDLMPDLDAPFAASAEEN